uniref:ARAD1C23408p n=1 Tax=Blastobotrys adeninivorans TaxID=409370 RepID=A0A060T6V3_BLAAD
MFCAKGASLVSLKTPSGVELNAHFDNPDNYGHPQSGYIGTSVGRVANRIFGANICINGHNYALPVMEDPNITLHGGPEGWSQVQWAQSSKERDGRTSTVFSHTSDHLDMGFPAKVLVTATYTPYTISEDGVKNVVELEYEATIADDSPVDETVVSITNHAYLNPSGSFDSISGTRAQWCTNEVLELASDKSGPTGRIVSKEGVPAGGQEFEFSDTNPALDDAFVVHPLDQFTKLDTRDREPKELVHLWHPATKAHVKVLSTEPIFQVYSSDGMNVPKLPGESRSYGNRCAIAVEPARPTSAATTDQWNQWVRLRKGDTYGSKIVWVAWDQ